VKKGRHRRFEEARALKRSTDVDFDDLLDSLGKSDDLTTQADPEPEDDYDDPYDPYKDESRWRDEPEKT